MKKHIAAELLRSGAYQQSRSRLHRLDRAVLSCCDDTILEMSFSQRPNRCKELLLRPRVFLDT